jgi:hypothetical protein
MIVGGICVSGISVGGISVVSGEISVQAEFERNFRGGRVFQSKLKFPDFGGGNQPTADLQIITSWIAPWIAPWFAPWLAPWLAPWPAPWPVPWPVPWPILWPVPWPEFSGKLINIQQE